jgi:hypothetical protein
VEISQVVPPEILSSIAQVRAAAEAASPAAHSALKHSVEAAEVIGTLTENVELANALVLRPLIGLNGFSAEKLAKLATPGAAKIAADLERIGDVSATSACRATGRRRKGSTRARPRRCARCCSRW